MGAATPPATDDLGGADPPVRIRTPTATRLISPGESARAAHWSPGNLLSVEGSGWGLLHYRPSDQRLIVLEAENQHKLSPWGTTPILGIDVWEHAYYLKYQNNRGGYIKNWWNVVNWSQVEKNLKSLM